MRGLPNNDKTTINIYIHFGLNQYSASTYKYNCLYQSFVVFLKLVINAHKSLKYAKNPHN